MKLLKTIRFDPSDIQVFDQAENADEWAISGGFLFSDASGPTLEGKTKQAFSNGFLSIESFGFSTFASVTEIEATKVQRLKELLAERFLVRLGAPSDEEALAAATEEIDFICKLCADAALNSIFTVKREYDENGDMREEFRIVQAPGGKLHTRVWEVLE